MTPSERLADWLTAGDYTRALKAENDATQQCAALGARLAVATDELRAWREAGNGGEVWTDLPSDLESRRTGGQQ